MKTIPLGLIGVGKHGSRYLHHLLSTETGGALLAISRRNQEEGVRLATEHSLRYYPDYRDLLADTEIQAVLIVTPPSLNCSIATEAMNLGKAVLVEKPLALNPTQARQIVSVVNKTGVPFMTAQTLRYEPAIQQLQNFARELGHWKYFSFTMRFDTRVSPIEKPPTGINCGVLMEFGIHLLDLVRVLAHDEIKSVSADLYRPCSQSPENQAYLKLITIKGLPCYLDISRVTQGRVTRAEIIGTEGQAVADWTTRTAQKITRGNETRRFTLPPTHTLVAVLQDFCQAIRNGSSMPITAEDGLRAVEIADACYQSAHLGKPVYLS